MDVAMQVHTRLWGRISPSSQQLRKGNFSHTKLKAKLASKEVAGAGQYIWRLFTCLSPQGKVHDNSTLRFASLISLLSSKQNHGTAMVMGAAKRPPAAPGIWRPLPLTYYYKSIMRRHLAKLPRRPTKQ